MIDLYEYQGKKVKITTIKGRSFEGIAEDYTAALNNTPPKDSICIGAYEIYADEIEKIEKI